MSVDLHAVEKSHHGDYVVRRPRSTDALGHALRGVFGSGSMPEDMMMMLSRIDRVTH